MPLRSPASFLILATALLAAPAWAAAVTNSDVTGPVADEPAAGGPSGSPLTRRISVLPPAIQPIMVGESYFTRYNFWYEHGVHVTTNYTRGALVPINTPVKLVSFTPRTMVLGLGSGEFVAIQRIPEFTLRPLSDVASELLGTEPVPIEQLGDELAASIRRGEMRIGMTKEQVLMTRGYPPRHRTPSLEADRWVYWTSRFVTTGLVFQDDVLVLGRGLR